MARFNFSKKELPKSEVEIAISVSAGDFELYRAQAVKNVQKTIELPGFRRGNVPEDVIRSKAGDMVFLEEMANVALGEIYPKLLSDEKIDAIGSPKVTITKLAKGNPFECTIRVAVTPEFSLPDYKKIAKEENAKTEDYSVTEKEIEDAVLEIRRVRAGVHAHGDGKLHDKDHNVVEKEPPLPELTDEFVKTLGKFENILGFKNKVGENLKLEKESRGKDKKRAGILDRIQKESRGEIPEILIEAETHKMFSQLKADLTGFGGKFEDYLKHTKKTEEDLTKEWRPEAERRVKTQFVVNAIAGKEKISPKEEDIKKEVGHLAIHYKDADPLRLAEYANQVLTNEEVMKFLEGQK